MRGKSKIAEKFWRARCEYPPVIYNSQRRYLDLGIVLDYIDNTKSILDLGCGEGQLLLMLRELTNIKYYYGYDISSTFITNLISRWGNYKGLNTNIGNYITTDKFPVVDMCVCMGTMLYVFDDNDLKNMLSNIKSKMFICRVPCTLGSERVEIEKFSDEFNDNYAAIYRTIQDYISILSDSFNIKSIDRCYPDAIESKYGSKQFYFICDKGEK